MVNLEDFVSQSIIQIVAGVSRAARETADSGSVVNPPTQGRKEYVYTIGNMQAPVEMIEFDVAVTAEKATEDQAKVGFLISVVGAGLGSKSGTTNQAVSRLKFSVPVALPVGNFAAAPKEDPMPRRNIRGIV